MNMKMQPVDEILIPGAATDLPSTSMLSFRDRLPTWFCIKGESGFSLTLLMRAGDDIYLRGESWYMAYRLQACVQELSLAAQSDIVAPSKELATETETETEFELEGSPAGRDQNRDLVLQIRSPRWFMVSNAAGTSFQFLGRPNDLVGVANAARFKLRYLNLASTGAATLVKPDKTFGATQ